MCAAWLVSTPRDLARTRSGGGGCAALSCARCAESVESADVLPRRSLVRARPSTPSVQAPTEEMFHADSTRSAALEPWRSARDLAAPAVSRSATPVGARNSPPPPAPAPPHLSICTLGAAAAGRRLCMSSLMDGWGGDGVREARAPAGGACLPLRLPPSRSGDGGGGGRRWTPSGASRWTGSCRTRSSASPPTGPRSS